MKEMLEITQVVLLIVIFCQVTFIYLSQKSNRSRVRWFLLGVAIGMTLAFNIVGILS